MPVTRTPSAAATRRRSPQLTASTESSDTTPHSPTTASGSLYGGPASSYLSGSVSTEGPYDYSNDDEVGEDEEMDDAETAAGRDADEDDEEMEASDEGGSDDPLRHATDEEVRLAAMHSLGLDPTTQELKILKNPFPFGAPFEHEDGDELSRGPVLTDAERLRVLWAGVGKGDVIAPSGEGMNEHMDDIELMGMLDRGTGLLEIPTGEKERDALKERVIANLRRLVKNLEEDEWMHPPAPAFSPPKLSLAADPSLSSFFGPQPASLALTDSIVDAHLAVAFNPLALPSQPLLASAPSRSHHSLAPSSTATTSTVVPGRGAAEERSAFMAPPRYPWANEDEDLHTSADVSLRELLGSGPQPPAPPSPPAQPSPPPVVTRRRMTRDSGPPPAAGPGGRTQAQPLRRSPRRTTEMRRSALAREVSRLDMH